MILPRKRVVKRSRKMKLKQRKTDLLQHEDDTYGTSVAPPLIALASAWVAYKNYQNSHEDRILKLKNYADIEKDIIQRMFREQLDLSSELGNVKQRAQTIMINLRSIVESLIKKRMIYQNLKNRHDGGR